MPYVKQERRRTDIGPFATDSAGDLNYHITRACQVFVGVNGQSYETLNCVIGALECAKLEFYRRLITVYEDKRIQENGDVY